MELNSRRPALARLLLCFSLCLGCYTNSPGNAICTTELRVPKLAMLFLARAGMPLERIWEPWFQNIVGLVPASIVKEQLCDSHDASAAHTLDCNLINAQEPILRQQLLFSVYVHSSRMNFTDFAAGSLFWGTLVKAQGKASWGDTSPAVRILLEASLADEMNHKFLLLSDTDIPLYPAKLTYTQLINEEKSRVDACHAYDFTNIHRYTCAMADDGIDLHHWRKSNLFMLLLRKHAAMFMEDRDIFKSFLDKCSGIRYDSEVKGFRGCLTDEHYYATLMAVKGLSHETDCYGAVTIANWTESVAGHPKMYNSTDIRPGLLTDLRKTISWMPKGKCANGTTYKAAEEAFLSLPLHGDNLDCGHIQHIPELTPMDTWCHAFYRKFDPSTVPGLLDIMTRGNDSFAMLKTQH